MDQQQEKKGFFQKLRHRYRLSIYRDETFEEVLNFRLTRLNVLAWGGLITIIFLAMNAA